MAKLFSFNNLVAAVKVEANKIMMAIIWKPEQITEQMENGWFMLGPAPWKGPIDYCHDTHQSKLGKIIMPFFDLTELLFDTEVDNVALHLVETQGFRISYQNCSSPSIKLADIRNDLKLPSKVIDGGVDCQICMDSNSDTILVTGYNYAHTVCRGCGIDLQKCPFTSHSILYKLRGFGILSSMRIKRSLDENKSQ
jgi:hypothetical protein